MAGKFTAKINFLPYDQYWQKIQLQYAAKKPFDIYYWDVQAYAHYKKGLIFNEQPAIDATPMVDAAKYPTELYDPWRFDGKNLFCVPDSMQSMVLFYNKAHFDEAGLDYPDATWTWDKVVETAPQLTRRAGSKVTRWGLDIGDLGVWWGIQTLAWAAGTAFVDKPLEPTAFQMTDPKVVEAMTLRPGPDVVQARRPAPGGARGGQREQRRVRLRGLLDDAGRQLEHRLLPADEGRLGDGPAAALPGQEHRPVLDRRLGRTAKSGAMSAAQAFALWSATKFQPTMAKNHDWIPLQNASRRSDEMLDGMPDGFSEAMENLPKARIGDIYTTNMQQIFNEVFGPNFDQLLNNKLTPEAAAQKMQDAATKLLT